MMGAYLQLQMSPSVLLVALTFFMQGRRWEDGMATATASGLAMLGSGMLGRQRVASGKVLDENLLSYFGSALRDGSLGICLKI